MGDENTKLRYFRRCAPASLRSPASPNGGGIAAVAAPLSRTSMVLRHLGTPAQRTAADEAARPLVATHKWGEPRSLCPDWTA